MKFLFVHNAVIERVAKRYTFAHFVNMRGALHGHVIHCTQTHAKPYDAADSRLTYYSNLVNPKDRGYDALRNVFLRAMTETLKERCMNRDDAPRPLTPGQVFRLGSLWGIVGGIAALLLMGIPGRDSHWGIFGESGVPIALGMLAGIPICAWLRCRRFEVGLTAAGYMFCVFLFWVAEAFQHAC